MPINSQSRAEAWALFKQLVEKSSDFELWPIASALLHHLLVKESVTRTQYSKGVFIVTDVLCEAADLQSRKGEPVNLDIYELSNLRKRHQPCRKSNRSEGEKTHEERTHAQ